MAHSERLDPLSRRPRTRPSRRARRPSVLPGVIQESRPRCPCRRHREERHATAQDRRSGAASGG
eukprot:1303062-Alexandrium_andersonii.AAC.1